MELELRIQRTDEPWSRHRPCSWRSALFIVVIMSAASEYALAQGLACSTVRPGESAARVAARIAGHAQSRHEPWFQIVDPRARRFIPKTDYDRIQAGWRACIVNDGRRVLPGVRTSTSGADHIADAGVALRAMLNGIESPYVVFGVLVLLLGLAARTVDEYLMGRQAVVWQLKRFGDRFIQEFERPLVPSRTFERVIDSRLRCNPYRARVDVLLAPRDGRRYPNLADHKRNLEYDVVRVTQLLKDHPFVLGPLYAEGRWVVVPFQLKVNAGQAGGQ